MKYICDTCGEEVTGGALLFIAHTEKHIVDIIKRHHPDWVEKSGVCPRCLDYFKKQLKGEKT